VFYGAMSLPSLECLSIGMLKREAAVLRDDDDARKQAKIRPPSKTAFFLWNDFLAWKELVLAHLGSDLEASQVVQRIVERGALPIRSNHSGNWFGIAADIRYRFQPKAPEGLTIYQHRKWKLVDLLKSGKPMSQTTSYFLLDGGAGNFTIRTENDLLLNPDENVGMWKQRKTHLHIHNLYPKNTPFNEWMTGGDLLYAAGIVFSLVDIDYMTLCEGPSVRRTAETPRRDPNSPLFVRHDYFYYDKAILGPAQHVEHEIDYPDGYDSSNDENVMDDMEHGNFHIYSIREFRAPDSDAQCWLWKKPSRL